MYAVLDIETTGGQFGEEGITEIAIYRFDGHEVTDQFISLVNPEIPIQPFVVKLTGINNAMLVTAPKFHEVAKRIVEITNDCILVAHNASFDFRILRTEFKRLGYDFQLKTLCTVELAQKLIPEQPSYSLGKLVRGLGIPITDRHRADGDAIATLKLFQLLLTKDIEKTIVSEFIKTEIEKGIEPKLQDFLEALPARTGVYYVYGEDGKLLYIGRGKNMRKHLNQHFTGNAKLSKRIQNEVFRVTFEETGSELIAQLKEQEEIKVNRPPYNRKHRNRSHNFGLFASTDELGYTNLGLRKFTLDEIPIAAFVSLQEGKNILNRITSDYGLCLKKNSLQIGDSAHCSHYTLEKCDGACVGEISPEDYNQRVFSFTDRNAIDEKSLMIVDRGRTISERSAILVEDGIYKGYTFFDLNYQIGNKAILKNILTAAPHSQQARYAIQGFLARNKSVKIIAI